MRSCSGASFLGLLALGLVGCPAPTTQLVVVVDTDISIPGGLDTIEVAVEGPTGMIETERATMRDRSTLPLTLGVAPSGDSLGPITVTAIGRHVGTLVVVREHTVTLIRGETHMLVMHLSGSCTEDMAPDCSDTETCTERGCRAILVDAAMLPPWTGTPPGLRDAGPSTNPDAGPTDGGGGDAGPIRCGTSTECEDGNPCTTDVCTATGCTSTPNTSACDDDVFCNGLDTCGGGTCSIHAGNPCGGATTCNEALGGRCDGCAADTDCPMPTLGAYGECVFSDGCTVTGTHTRTARRFACVSTSCVPTDTVESADCGRSSTDGMPCASRTCNPDGPCGGFSDECDQSGEATRNCFEGVCSGGSCSTVPVNETVGCSRDTNGAGCGPSAGCGGWSSCTGFAEPCGMNGTHDRTCQDRGSCSGGSCNVPSPYGQSEGCTRPSTDGVGCGGDVCTDWGGCAYDWDCATTGTRGRTCQPMVCGGGSCGLGGARAETDTSGCNRSTDGYGCEDGDFCTTGDYCSGGYCYGGWYQCGGW